jgi:SAM-dependent methyltransferase
MAKNMPDHSETTGQGGDLPPAFDAAFYLGANADLDLSPADAAEHYRMIGRAEGRVASPLALRENLIALIADGRSVLEIGPFCNPLLRGPNISYLDVLDADQLRARAVEIGADPAGCPTHIDYVGGLEQVRRHFDAVISSHAIEHQPDLIEHLRQVERILAPDGLFCLIIPDKRYCFDHFIAESTIAQVIQAHREQRRTHSLASVIEHVALTTHNDSHRHWAGDHGPRVHADLPVRVDKAIRDHDFGMGRYIDVHAWYFTPDGFRTIVDTLNALEMTGLELAGVYDPARGRNEFCAVLRLSAAARRQRQERRDAGDDGVILLQTADADRYAPMLAVTATNVREYARRHGHGYESFVGIKRGFHPWQATFNRIPMLAELLDRGFAGWALYLDADAYIQDLDFDLTDYLADKDDRAAIFATSGVTGQAWDVNAGVALINFGHPQGRALVQRWAERFAAHDDAFLRDAAEWLHDGNDQDFLHHILREEPEIGAAVLVEQMAFINGPHASFIRQHLRTMSPTLQGRLEALTGAVAETLDRKSVV